MASYNNILVIFAIFAITVPAVTMATEYWVGGTSGWNKDVDYKAWASDKTFFVGDTLVFNYTMGSHNVFKVNATAFAGCEVPPPNEMLSSGHDVVTLATPGKKWYICGKQGHCSEHNQKLVIDVHPTYVYPWPQAPAQPPTSGSTKSGYRAFMAAAVIMALVVLLV